MPKSTKKKYKSKIDPVTLYIIYEGAVDEFCYFTNFQNSIQKRFRQLIKVVPIERETTISAPIQVLGEARSYLANKSINLSNGSSKLYIVIDKDQNFKSGQKIANTRDFMRQCEQARIEYLFTAPAFDVWLLLHKVDLSVQDSSYLQKIIENKHVSINKTFTKREVTNNNIRKEGKEVLQLIPTALENEKKINESYRDLELEDDVIRSHIGRIFNTIKELNIDIFSTKIN